jgi:hypothetical protein
MAFCSVLAVRRLLTSVCFVVICLKGVHDVTSHGRFTEIPGFSSVGFGLGWFVSFDNYVLFLFFSSLSSADA